MIKTATTEVIRDYLNLQMLKIEHNDRLRSEA